MNVLWLSWKDNKHPLAGGAEVVSTELRERLVKDGHNVRLLTSKPEGLKSYETTNGVGIVRNGGKYSVYYESKKYFKKNMQKWPDLIIDEMNTLPFFGYQYSSKPTLLLTYQLARKVWFYQMMFPLSAIGYFLETIYLRFISKKYLLTLTESNSTKIDLIKHGFNTEDIRVFRVGMDIEPINHLHTNRPKNKILFLGSVRPMKRTLHAVKAFEIARDNNTDIRLDIVGDYSGPYGTRVYNHVQSSRHKEAIKFHGKVSLKEKQSILKSSSIILITSIKEGWGLIATEAAAYGVPAVAYNVDGLRDSIIDNETGLLAPSGDIKALSSAICNILNDREKLERMGRNALENSKQYTFENSYSDFVKTINRVMEKNEE